MPQKILKTTFGQFDFLDDRTVVATANDGVNIDGKKVQSAIELIENELSGNYALILNRKHDYSIMPVEVYKFFSSLKKLKAIAIVSYKKHDFLPDNMEQSIFGENIEKFSSIEDAHNWIRITLK